MMDKILEFGRKAFFIARVITGYEERRIRAHRLMLQKQIEQAKAKREAVRRIPEQVILAQVRRMVDEMQTVVRQFEETEAAIERYMKPFDRDAKIIMDMQMEKEEKSAKDMLRAMHREAVLKNFDRESLANDLAGTRVKSDPLPPPEDGQRR